MFGNSKQSLIMDRAFSMVNFLDINKDKELNYNNREDLGIAAIITDSEGRVISSAKNEVYKKNNPCMHAEIIAISKATKKLKSKLLLHCDIYITLEPCPMCAFAISLARLRRVYIGKLAKKTGGIISNVQIFEQKCCNWKPEVYY